MTAKAPLFVCTNCDAQYSKWIGRCLQCGTWGTIEENARTTITATAGPGQPAAQTYPMVGAAEKPIERILTGMHELDRVLGGGLVPGSLILLGGEPGIGKSTLALQLGIHVPKTLYISAEESVEQIRLRGKRILPENPPDGLRLATTTALEHIVATVKKEQPMLAIIDSIQTISATDVGGEPGNVNQIRACTVALLELAKSTGTPILLIGHVTKEGSVADQNARAPR